MKWMPLVVVPVALAACSDPREGVLSGYAEGEYVRVASPVAGALDKLAVERGYRVAANQPLFVLEQVAERAARDQAAAQLATTQAALENLKKGRRPEEIAAIRAQHAQAVANLAVSSANLERQQQLVAQRFVSPTVLDEAGGAERRDRARVAELAAQLQVAKLAARVDEITAAEQSVAAAKEALAQAQWKLDQKSQAAPAAGLVQDTFYRPGEWIPAGAPVVSLLPPENLKLRFFVPQPQLGALAVGSRIAARCDGCGDPIPATVSYIAPEAEYTPPVIYSRESRAKLVFLVEARPAAADATRLHPGQPVDVTLGGAGR